MAFDKSEVMNWNAEEKRNLAFELLDSIDEETINRPLTEWKRNLIQQRIEKDKQSENDVFAWHAVREKYKRCYSST